jgi:hypothetical protein
VPCDHLHGQFVQSPAGPGVRRGVGQHVRHGAVPAAAAGAAAARRQDMKGRLIGRQAGVVLCLFGAVEQVGVARRGYIGQLGVTWPSDK